jgi:UDP-N-acetylglucosamine 2-epimerase (non-hydrolysing)/GDP/UDP-N,N'-diacetylbacillosamine 2-epimerase (hydrolysing)
MKKILSITTIRSDYDLLSPLYKKLNSDKDIDLKLLVSGAHLSTTYGYSIKSIQNDGFDILCKIETLIDSDSKRSRLKTASILLQNSIDIVAQYNPDLIIYAGDREDVIIGALLGGYLDIPTVHFYGGDHVQDLHIDNPIRHATSKLSTVHMVSTEEHRKRLLKIGESDNRIHVIGSISLDKFNQHQEISKDKIRREFNIKSGFKNYALVIFHPVSTEQKKAYEYFENILKVLEDNNINAFVGYPNTDPGNKGIINIIKNYQSNVNFVFYKNLKRNIFLSIYKNADFLIGNSSSGILEAASIPIPVINVGLRQKGRTAPQNVIFCKSDKNSINTAIKKISSDSFKNRIKDIKNPYGDGNSAQKAYDILKQKDFNDLFYKVEDPLEININNEIGDLNE